MIPNLRIAVVTGGGHGIGAHGEADDRAADTSLLHRVFRHGQNGVIQEICTYVQGQNAPSSIGILDDGRGPARFHREETRIRKNVVLVA